MKKSYTVYTTFLTLLFSCFLSNAQVSVVTQHNNLYRTGWNDREVILTKQNVQAGSFGKLFTRGADDQIYAQPLVLLKVNMPGVGIKNVVYVATVNNTVYAYDADSANVSTPYWQKSLTPAGSRPVKNSDMTGACGGFYQDFSGNMGIVGTPVIDTATNTLYVVARSLNTSSNTYFQYLHALDVTTGAEKPNSPVEIKALASGNGDGSVSGIINFDPQKQNQRPGLLLLNGIVYIAYSSHCDWGPYHGWVLGYDASTLARKIIYNNTPEGYNGGIWMSGAAPAADESGNIYLASGNGSVGLNGDFTNTINRSESALKLKPFISSLTVSSFFTPLNIDELEGADLDFGVTQVLLIPNTTLAFVGCKDGKLYLLNRDNMGGYNPALNNVIQTIDLGSNAHLRCSFSYYKGPQNEFVYVWSENALLKALSFNQVTGKFDLDNTISSGVQGPVGNNGALLSVTSNGQQDNTAILWASHAANGDANQSVRPGILRALDANDVTHELWNSSLLPTDNVGNYAKFVCPTVTNGKVYLATFSNQLVVYGLTGNNADTCNTLNVALNKPAVASSVESASYPASNAFDGNVATKWSSANTDAQWIYVDLQKTFNLCRVVLKWSAAFGKDFIIQTSGDAQTWKNITSVTGNTSATNSIDVSGSSRYVRLWATARGTQSGYGLNEFEVYGNEAGVICTAPSKLYTTDVYETTVTLNWQNDAAASYNVQYKNVVSPDWTTVTSNTNSISLTGLACGSDYIYRVQRVCSATSVSNYSVAAFSTLACNSNCGPLPTRWTTQDIGTTGIAGSACYDNGVFTLKGSGDDIWDVQDAFRFAYKTLVGDGEISARVLTMDQSNEWNKCGIMIRENLTPGSRHAFIALTSGNGVAFQYRDNTNFYSYNTNDFGYYAPQWIKLVKQGTTFNAYRSGDGINWQQVGSAVNVGFGANNTPIYAGLALTSHNNNLLSVATVDSYTLGGVLPVHLVNFTAQLINTNTVELKWTTSKEINTRNFVIEKSTDAHNYSEIAKVEASKNGNTINNYQSIDNTPATGLNFYRLRIVDVDGKFSYSPVATVRSGNFKTPLLYPNPADALLNIAQGLEPIKTINMYNIAGSVVMQYNNKNNQSIINIPTGNLAKGIYVVEIRTATATYRQKFVKQ